MHIAYLLILLYQITGFRENVSQIFALTKLAAFKTLKRADFEKDIELFLNLTAHKVMKLHMNCPAFG